MKVICIHLISILHLTVAKLQEADKHHQSRQKSVTAPWKNLAGVVFPLCAQVLLTRCSLTSAQGSQGQRSGTRELSVL